MSGFLLNSTKFCIRNIQSGVSKISAGNILYTQTRSKITIRTPRLRNPIWFVRKTRTLHDDFITPENKTFVKEVLSDRYGPPSIIKGVQSYQNSVSSYVKHEELPTKEWTPRTRRCGAIARKIGQYPLWKKDGTKIRTTLLQIVDNHVIKYIPPEEYKPAQKSELYRPNKLGCLMIGAESTDPSLLTKEYCGLFKDSGVMPKRILARFHISPSAVLSSGTPITVSHFRVGDYVDIRGKTVYRDFQGVMKRHGFKGMPASHGVTKTHRRGGNIGGGGEKARVWPGTKMPGHMGNRWKVSRGLKIWRINTKYNVMWVTGSAIAGETNNMVYIYDTVLPLRKPKTSPPFPTNFSDDDNLVEDIWYEDLHDFKDPTILFTPE